MAVTDYIPSRLWRTLQSFFRTEGGFEGKEIATPSNPGSGYSRVYPKTDHKWYRLSSSGDEEELGGGGTADSTTTGYGGEVCAQYASVYPNKATNRWLKAQCDGTATEGNGWGIVTEAGGIDTTTSGEITIFGSVTNPAWSWTPLAELFVSATAGELTEVQPTTVGQYARPVALALSATTIYVLPQTGWLIAADNFDTSTGHDHDGADSKKVDYANLTGTPIDVVGGRMVATDTTHLRWAFVTSNQIVVHDGTNWQLVRCTAEDSVLNTANDVAGTGLAVDKVYDVFAKYVSATEISLEFARWKVATAGSSARHETYNNANAYAIGDRVLSSSVYYLCIQAQGTSAGKTPADFPAYWESLGAAPANSDFNGLYIKDGIPVLGSGSTYCQYRWLGCIYAYSNGGTVNFKDDSTYMYVSNFYNPRSKQVMAYNSGTAANYSAGSSVAELNAATAVRANIVTCITQDVAIGGKFNNTCDSGTGGAIGLGMDAVNAFYGTEYCGVLYGLSTGADCPDTPINNRATLTPGYHWATIVWKYIWASCKTRNQDGSATFTKGNRIVLSLQG